MKRVLGKLAGVALLAMAALWSAQAQAAIKNTKHDLSVSSTGATIKATSASETQICVFCHVPHNASIKGPLWNRDVPATAYNPYQSSTTFGGSAAGRTTITKTKMGAPDGDSLLCLSCHDGTIAAGKLLNKTVTMTAAMTGTTLVGGLTGGVYELADDHPVSFTFDATLAAAKGELTLPLSTSKVKLRNGGKVQCTSCHDPHTTAFPKFLVENNVTSTLCKVCHTRTNWADSSHANGAKLWNGNTIANNACANCHRSHAAGPGAVTALPGKERLLNSGVSDEANCYSCHDTAGPAKNIAAESVKAASAHRVGNYSAVHDAAEFVGASSNALTTSNNVSTKHVECVDCHNPHQTKGPASTNAVNEAINPPALPLRGARGTTLANAVANPVNYEYEICFRCHGDTATIAVATPLITRQIAQMNTRLEFQTGNPSFHPVGGSRGLSVGSATAEIPSLLTPWTATSTIKCTHCHNNDSGPILGVAGSGPNGPHGSTNHSLLNKQYVTTDNTAESAANYALCYSCHSRTSILADESFTEHNKHINGESAPCSTCHDAHGIYSSQGNTTNNRHLINFNTGPLVGTDYTGVVRKPRNNGAIAGDVRYVVGTSKKAPVI